MEALNPVGLVAVRIMPAEGTGGNHFADLVQPRFLEALSVTLGVTPFPYRIPTGVTPSVNYENNLSRRNSKNQRSAMRF